MRDYGFDTAKILNAGRMGSYFNSKWDGDEGRTQSTDRWTADAYVDDAIAFIERSGDRPFFVDFHSAISGQVGRAIGREQFVSSVTRTSSELMAQAAARLRHLKPLR